MSDEDVNIRVAIDRKTGDYEAYRCWTVVTDEEALEDTCPSKCY